MQNIKVRLLASLQFVAILFSIQQLVYGAPIELNGGDGKDSNLIPVPRPFSDDLLPEGQRQGELVANLGRVMLLDTYMPHKSTDDMKTTFTIFTNHHDPVRGIVITPDSWATLGRPAYPNVSQTESGRPGQQQFGPYHFDLDLILTSGFDATKRTVIMIPGYFSPGEASWVRDARIKWLELDRDVNVIDVSWTDSNQCTYSRAVAHTVLVARQVTIFLHYLAELSGTTLRDQQFLDRIHLVGHSLGAHISGFVGQDLAGRVGRITGLDPAGPTFDQFKRSQRLDKSDAKLVEVLHTNSGQMKYLNFLASAPLHALNSISFLNKLSNSMANSYTGEGDTAWFGIEQQIGHIDYYANNGRVQAGCEGILHICDHKRARDIYVDLLHYECALRRSQSTASLLSLIKGQDSASLTRVNRLLAFKSPDYETFASGSNFIMNCPELMTISKHLDDEQVLKSFRNCSIPLLDFLRPTGELIEELKSVYGINFEPDEDDNKAQLAAKHNETSLQNVALIEQTNKNPAYYFKTSYDSGKLVGDHYLLKIYLLDEPLWDPAACTLETQIILNDGEKIHLDLRRVIHPSANQQVLAIPFVHLDSSKAKDQFNNLMKLIKLVDMESDDEDDYAEDELESPAKAEKLYEPSPDFVEVFQDLFPKTIMLTLAKPKSTSVFGTMRNMSIRMIKSSDEIPLCRLTIDMIEVHPIVYGLKRNFGALYGRDLFLGSHFNSTLAVMSTDDQLNRLDDPNKFITTLSADSISSFGVGLEAVVMG